MIIKTLRLFLLLIKHILTVDCCLSRAYLHNEQLQNTI